jgi:hypothetical protein
MEKNLDKTEEIAVWSVRQGTDCRRRESWRLADGQLHPDNARAVTILYSPPLYDIV